ncbi:MAG: SGNH/GDSL hydrolase family protein [Armatimonadetes bacterium]|nr:SGNH/GDSL hydrolase family protein [Armatimonadota bacterium]
MPRCFFLIGLALCAASALPALPNDAKAQGNKMTEKEILKRSLVSTGSTARLRHVLARARRGEPVTVAVIGGSITQGAAASSEETRYGNLVARWWREKFPKAKITFVNAGIGATGSDSGSHRAEIHLLKHKPDFVVAEYAVNDANSRFAAETLEGLCRQILMMPNRPALMLLFTMYNNGGNAQEWHSKIGKHYKLPMVSFRDALWPEIEAGRLKWEDVEADLVHPNDRGHAYCAEFITAVIERVLRRLPADSGLPAIPSIPRPLISDTFQYTACLNADSLTPSENKGWKTIPPDMFFGRGWEADAPGSVLSFEVEGTAISVLFYRIKGAMGTAEAWVDDTPPVKMNAWFEADWGGYYPFQLIARDLAPGKHRLTIRLLDEKAPESQGHLFRVQAVMAAGRK